MIPNRKIGDIVTCPICKNKFKLTENHKFIRKNDFVCSWYCFIDKPQKHTESVNSNVSEGANVVTPTKEDKQKEYRRNYYLKKKKEREQNAVEAKFKEEILF